MIMSRRLCKVSTLSSQHEPRPPRDLFRLGQQTLTRYSWYYARDAENVKQEQFVVTGENNRVNVAIKQSSKAGGIKRRERERAGRNGVIKVRAMSSGVVCHRKGSL